MTESIPVGVLFSKQELEDIFSFCDEKEKSFSDAIRELVLEGIHV